MADKIRVSVVVGTRPNLIKISPLVKILAKDQGFKLQLIDTGQHYDYELDGVFVKQLRIPKPIFLDVGSGPSVEQIERARTRIERALAEFKPDIVLVIGDTNSTLAGALAAAKLGIPLGHIETGLRSFDWRMPEEINRIIVDHMSDLLFAPTKNAVKNLKNERIPKERVFFTYDISVDACLGNYQIAKKSKIAEGLGIGNDFVLVTLHRPSNVDDGEVLSSILNALVVVSKSREVVFPIHPRTLKRLKEFGMFKKYSKSIKFIKPLGYFDFLRLLGSAKCVVTDSGGIQKEALILKTPCITVRDTTEWPETLEGGGNTLVLPDRIPNEVSKRCSPGFHKLMKGLKNPYGDGGTSKRILKILKEYDGYRHEKQA